MALVSLADVWVVANFKETQLRNVRGQRHDRSQGSADASSTGTSTASCRNRRQVQPPAAENGQLREGRAASAGQDRSRAGQDPDHQLRPGMSVFRRSTRRNGMASNTDRQPVDRRDRRHVRDVHGSPGHDGRQRLAAAHRRQPVGDIDESTWVLTSSSSLTIVLPLTGWPGGHFGRKRLLMTSVTGFTIASFLCGLAPNLPLLVTFRLIQGATGGDAAAVAGRSPRAFPPQDRGRAMGFWGLGIVVAPSRTGLGGWLTDTYSWRWVFYINLPVGIASLVMTKLSYSIRRTETRDEPDRLPGIGLLACGSIALQLVLDLGQERDWLSSLHPCAGHHFGRRLIAFLVREWTAREPVVDLRVFKSGATARVSFDKRRWGSCYAGASFFSRSCCRPCWGPIAAGRHCDGAPRDGIAHRNAGRRNAHRANRSAQDGGGQADRRCVHALLARRAESHRLLGHFLAAVPPGNGAVTLFVPLTTISMDQFHASGWGMQPVSSI